MWCEFNSKSGYLVTACLIAGGVAISSTVFAARERNYTPREFRSVLYGLGYDVKISDAPLIVVKLSDAQTQKAIREFQQGYKIEVDGIAGTETQNLAAKIIKSLKYNLNLVANPNPKLTLNQFYGPRTEEVVQEYQQKLQVEPSGIADLAFRQELNQQAKQNKRQVEPTANPRTMPSPTPSPTATPEVTPTPVIPEATPTPEVTPEVTPTPVIPETTPSPTATPEITPTPVIPKVTPTPELPEETPTPQATPTPTESPDNEDEEAQIGPTPDN